jgi:flagellar biosynthesis protein FlhG
MHSDFRIDQAEGLRKLLLGERSRTVTLMAGKAGLGRTTAIISLAATLARRGKRVLVIDENGGTGNVTGRLRLPAGRDLLDVLQGRGNLRDAIHTTHGYSVLSSARAVQLAANLHPCDSGGVSKAPRSAKEKSVNHSRHDGETGATQLLQGMLDSVDVILIDAAVSLTESMTAESGRTHNGHRCVTADSRLSTGTVLVVMVDGTHQGITEGYATIKRLALEQERLQFEIVVNRVADEPAAVTVYENMARLARRNLAVRLELLGWIPRDENIKRANQLGKALVDLFPSSPSALSYVQLAQKLLCLPVRQEEVEGHAGGPIHELINRSSQSQYRYAENLYTL